MRTDLLIIHYDKRNQNETAGEIIQTAFFPLYVIIKNAFNISHFN